MAIRPAVFQRQAHVFTSTTFMLSTENIWNCRQSFRESRDGDFLCSKFLSTFQQSFCCLCSTPLLSWEPGDVSPWLDHGSVWGLCGPRRTFGTHSPEKTLLVFTLIWLCSGYYLFFQPRSRWEPNLAMISITVNAVPIAELLVKGWHKSLADLSQPATITALKIVIMRSCLATLLPTFFHAERNKYLLLLKITPSHTHPSCCTVVHLIEIRA